MDVAGFEDHLDRYGADLNAWPAVTRAEAAVLLEASPQARAAFLSMSEVERFLRVRPPLATSGIDAMAAKAMTQRQLVPPRRGAARAGWAAAAAVVLSLGVFVGDVSPPDHDESPDRVMAAAFDTTGSVDVD